MATTRRPGTPSTQRKKRRIIIVLLSETDGRFLQALARSLQQTFHASVLTRSLIRSLDSAYDPARGQYRSPRLLSRLRRIKREAGDKVLGIVDVDLYSPGFDFVFGEAEIASGVATLSLHRLRPGSYDSPADESLFYERAAKEAVHELGHLYGLGHCPNRRCVMSFSTNLSKVDRKRGAFCPECTAEQEGP